MKSTRKIIALLACICLSVSLFSAPASAAVPTSVQIVSTIMTTAYSKIGCPYVWAAKGPNSFDCSGLTYWCYNAAGITIPQGRAYEQKVYLENMGCLCNGQRSGSYLIFYNYGTNAAETGIGHVSIDYGGGYIIHASSSKGKVVKATYSSSGVVAVCRPQNWFY